MWLKIQIKKKQKQWLCIVPRIILKKTLDYSTFWFEIWTIFKVDTNIIVILT